MAKIKPQRKNGERIFNELPTPDNYPKKQFWMDMSEQEIHARINKISGVGKNRGRIALLIFLLILILFFFGLRLSNENVSWLDYSIFGLALSGIGICIFWVLKNK